MMKDDVPYFMKTMYVLAVIAMIVLYLDLFHWRP
jgi:hypothetical protein